MVKAELFKAEPIVENDEVFMVLEFSEVARWTPKVLVKGKITIIQFIKFIDAILKYREEGVIPNIEDELTSSFTKTAGRIIYKEFYFTLKIRDLYKLVEIELEKLFLSGILRIE